MITSSATATSKQSPAISSFPDYGILRDRFDTETIVNSIADLSPVTTLCDLADVIPEEDEYQAMPKSLRRVLTPPPALQGSPSRPRSVLFESNAPQTSPSIPSSPYSKAQWPSTSYHHAGTDLFRARQSVSSIGSCSTVHTRTVPVKSILTRHDSGISIATAKPPRRKKRRSPPSVKFVDAPTVHYDHAIYLNTPPPGSPPAPDERRKIKISRWLTMWWKRSPSRPPRPTISGPYHLSYSASLVDVYSSRSPKPVAGRLKRFWVRVTNAIG